MTNVTRLLSPFILGKPKILPSEKNMILLNILSSMRDVNIQRLLFTQSHFNKDNQRIT